MQPIKSNEEYEDALACLDQLFEIEHRSKEEQREFDHLAKLIDAYEDEHWSMSEE